MHRHLLVIVVEVLTIIVITHRFHCGSRPCEYLRQTRLATMADCGFRVLLTELCTSSAPILGNSAASTKPAELCQSVLPQLAAYPGPELREFTG